jgi:hypothetical protein
MAVCADGTQCMQGKNFGAATLVEKYSGDSAIN